MEQVDEDVARVLASDMLLLLDQASARVAPFVFKQEQLSVLSALTQYPRLAILKGRQVGISTICCLHDMLFAMLNPGVSVCIVADVADKSIDLLSKCSRWAKQLCPGDIDVDRATRLTFTNGSSIDAKSAISPAEDGEARVGRSGTYGLIHCSEMAFWRGDRAVFAALTSTALPDAKVVIESTASPTANLFRSIWDDESDGWHHMFLSIEEHEAYRRNPDGITDDQWEHAVKAYGFTRRDSAAWWVHKLQTDFLGDTHACLREYPIRPAHAFAFARGRWIVDYQRADTLQAGMWEHYKAADEPVILGVDTAKGTGKDGSAIAVIGHRTGEIVATFKRHDIDIAAFCEEVVQAAGQFSPIAVVIESNGVGQASYHLLRTRLFNCWEQVSSNINGEKDVRMRKVRNGFATGQLKAGPDVKKEIEHSVINEKGDFTGPDDILNAISFALKWRADNPWRAGPAEYDMRNVFVPPALRKRKAKRGY